MPWRGSLRALGVAALRTLRLYGDPYMSPRRGRRFLAPPEPECFLWQRDPQQWKTPCRSWAGPPIAVDVLRCVRAAAFTYRSLRRINLD
jgi:hypothetical protein